MRALVAFVLFVATMAAQEPTPPVPAAAKVDFQKQIAPLLVDRCIDCHGPKEQKGDLRLDQKAHLFADGGGSVVPGRPDDSDLLRRLGLPVDDDEVMPQKGEPLTKEQQLLFRQWIAEGAEWPEAADAWLQLEIAARVLPKITFTLPELDDSQRAAIERSSRLLRERGALVQPVAADTDALDVNLSLLREQVTDADLGLLAPLAPRLVWLNLSRTAITDAAAPLLGQLTQLRRLQLANTKVGDGLCAALPALVHLQHLNAYGTAVGDAGLAELAPLTGLRRVYVWQSRVTRAGAEGLQKQIAGLQVDLGDYAEARLAAAQQEIDLRKQREKPINTSCPVGDKPIDPSQTVEHDGRRIAFCCAKCKAAFLAEPAKYLGKLPAKVDGG